MANPRAAEITAWNNAPMRKDIARYAPLIQAALYRGGVRGSVAVHHVLCVLEDRGHKMSEVVWGDLCGFAVEALAIADRKPREWDAVTLGHCIPFMYRPAQSCTVAELALSDDTLGQLVMRHEAWSLSPKEV